MLIPVAIFLALNAGRSSAHGWGAAMSTDTAFALGLLALVGSRGPFRLRAFVLTFAVVDDVIALVVIATVYATAVDVGALTEALAIFALIIVVRQLRIRIGAVYAVLGIATWIALSRSGVDPIVVGLGMGLLTYAAPASRNDLERATDLFGSFASSRRRSSRAARRPESRPRSRRTSDCRRSSIRGRAT
jgi:Na+/H+ antiporter NhaA